MAGVTFFERRAVVGFEFVRRAYDRVCTFETCYGRVCTFEACHGR